MAAIIAATRPLLIDHGDRVTTRLIGALVVDNASLTKSLDVVTRFGDSTPSFPFVRLAVIVAVIGAASPYLTRPMRRIGQILILLMALAAMYLGTALPDGILAAVVIGWGIAAVVHLAFGSPGGRPTREHVALALEELRVPVDDVELYEQQPYGSTLMSPTDAAGLPEIRVLGRDEADAQFLGKLWRSFLYKDSGARIHLTRLEDVEHEAYALLLAEHRHDPRDLAAGGAQLHRVLELVGRVAEAQLEQLALEAAQAPLQLLERGLADLPQRGGLLHHITPSRPTKRVRPFRMSG